MPLSKNDILGVLDSTYKYISNKENLENHSMFKDQFKNIFNSLNNLRRKSSNKPIIINNRKESAKFEVIKKVEEPESVLNMLFPYVNENDFRIEPFKSGTDIREEYLQKRQNSKVVKVNLERRIKSNFIRKYKKLRVLGAFLKFSHSVLSDSS